MKVLHVEDDPAVAELYGLVLTTLGHHEVTLRSDGESGLSAALSGSFDVVLLDLRLPRLGGQEVLERLRRADLRPQPAVVVLTSDDDPATHRSLLAAGASSCLVKGRTTPQALIVHLAGVTGNGRGGHASVRGRQAEAGWADGPLAASRAARPAPDPRGRSPAR